MAFDPVALQQAREQVSEPSLANAYDPGALDAQRNRGSFIDAVNQGAGMGFSDEIAGLRNAILPEFLGGGEGTLRDFPGNYASGRDEERDDLAAFTQRNPKTAIAGEALGALGTGGLGLGKFFLKKGAGWANNLWRGGIGGGVEGGIYGGGISEPNPEDSFTDQALQVGEDIGLGAAIGVPTGMAGGVIGGAVANKLASNKQAKTLLNTPAPEGQYVPGQGPRPMKPDARVATKQLEDRSPLSPARAFGNDQKVITNQAGKESVKQGVDPRTVSVVRNSAPGDKGKMREMLEMKLENMRSTSKGGTPKRIIGESMLERYKHLNKVKNTAGGQIDAAVDRIPSVDLSMAKINMKRRLTNMGAQMDGDGNLSFPEGTKMFGQAGQKEVDKVLKQAKAIGDSPREMHEFKRWLDGIIYTRKGDKSTGPLNQNVESFLDGVRADVNKALSDVSPEYAQLNKTYSEITEQFSELHRLGGNNFDPNGKYSDELLGNLSRRMISNAQSSGSIREISEALTELGNKYNGKFDDDLYNLVEWQVELDRILGATPGNTYQSESQQAVEAGMRGDTKGLSSQFIRKAWDSASDVNDEARIKALFDLLGD